jgi:hypothetical protein
MPVPITNDTDAFKQGFGEYLNLWFNDLHPNTTQSQAFIDRGFANSVKWAAGRMIDDAEAMLSSYRRNENTDTVNQSSLFPIVLVALARDYTPTTGDWFGKQMYRHLVRFTDDEDASVYGYKQSAHDVRVQLAFMAAEEPTARNLVNHFCWWLSQYTQRRFLTRYTWGEYTLENYVMLETPDIIAQNVSTEQKNAVILSCDIQFKVTVPHVDAPVPPADTDGLGRNPEGYPNMLVDQINVKHVKNLTDPLSDLERGESTMVINESDIVNTETN